jgi:hypothetical protein
VGQPVTGTVGQRTGSHGVTSTAGASGAASQAGKVMSETRGMTHDTRSTHSGVAKLGTVMAAGTAFSTSGVGGASSCEVGGGVDGPEPPPLSGGGACGGGGASSPGQSHTQSQFHVQSSPVPSPASVEISVVVPHQVNVHDQIHDGSPEAAGAGVGDVFVWVTGPSSPGLRTLIDTLTFAGPGCGVPDPRFSSSVLDAVGVVLAAGGSSHDQFQIQFHVQSRELLSPVSSDSDKTLPSQTVRVQFQFHGASS